MSLIERLSACSPQEELFHYEISSSQENAIRESFLLDKLGNFTKVRRVFVHLYHDGVWSRISSLTLIRIMFCPYRVSLRKTSGKLRQRLLKLMRVLKRRTLSTRKQAKSPATRTVMTTLSPLNMLLLTRKVRTMTRILMTVVRIMNLLGTTICLE
jgi:hypothetical protein